MTQSTSGDPGNLQETTLPRRDWVLLPALALSTILVLAGSTILMARWLFPSSEVGLENCFVKNDPSGDARAVPNSVCAERIVESKYLAEYAFNSCGHRAGVACGQKPPGTYRIVMIGSSLAMGLFVPREMTFAALLPTQLSRQTGRKIELYNEASGGKFRGGPFPVRSSAIHFDEVLSAGPDAILWIVTPADLRNMAFESPPGAPQVVARDTALPGKPTARLAVAWKKLLVAAANGSLASKLRGRWEGTTASLVLKHFLYRSESQDQYVKSYLKNEDDAGFLKTEPDAKWQRLLQTFAIYSAQFEQQSRAAGVPLVATLVPNRAQAAMISMDEWPVGYDPYKLDDEVRAIIESHGGTYIDILPDFRNMPNPEQHYFPVDGHPDAGGHAMIAGFLAKELTSGAVPALKAAANPQVETTKGN